MSFIKTAFDEGSRRGYWRVGRWERTEKELAMKDRSPEEMSPTPLEAYVGLSMIQHTCADTHTLVLQWWWGLEEPERLISHHGGKLKGCQRSLSPSSVSCCLQASAPCCVFWFQAEGKDHLWSKLRSWIKSNGLAHYREWSEIDGTLKTMEGEIEISPWHDKPIWSVMCSRYGSRSKGYIHMYSSAQEDTYCTISHAINDV